MINWIMGVVLLLSMSSAAAVDGILTLKWSPPLNRENGDVFTTKEIKYYHAEWYDRTSVLLSTDVIADPNAVQFVKTVPASITISYVMLKVCDINDLCSRSVKVESTAITKNNFKPPTNLRVN